MEELLLAVAKGLVEDKDAVKVTVDEANEDGICLLYTSYRNAINIGLPIFECEAASDGIAAGDEVRVDFDTGLITNLTKNETYQAQPLPPFIQNIVNRGGLLNSLK